MPKFSLPSLQNSNHIIDNSNFDYEVFLLNVWATWCSGCLEEHPFLMQLSKTNQIPIIGLNWRDNKKDAIDWLENYGDPYNLIANDNLGRVAIDWGVYGAPESFLVDSNGIIIHKHLGPLNKKIWEQDFVSLIRDVKNK
jgi:cytochrome c biogenesis protein CcmG/thiol:disulfide interchange protein DsbE